MSVFTQMLLERRSEIEKMLPDKSVDNWFKILLNISFDK